jgi:hypothetical protein
LIFAALACGAFAATSLSALTFAAARLLIATFAAELFLAAFRLLGTFRREAEIGGFLSSGASGLFGPTLRGLAAALFAVVFARQGFEFLPATRVRPTPL